MTDHTPGSAGAVTTLEPDTPATSFDHPLPRLTKRVFTDLAIWMVGLGRTKGVVSCSKRIILRRNTRSS